METVFTLLPNKLEEQFRKIPLSMANKVEELRIQLDDLLK